MLALFVYSAWHERAIERVTSDAVATARRRTSDDALARQASRAAHVPLPGARVFVALFVALAEFVGPSAVVAKRPWLAS